MASVFTLPPATIMNALNLVGLPDKKLIQFKILLWLDFLIYFVHLSVNM